MTDYEDKAAPGTDVAGAFDEFMHAFEEFKSTNDERLEQVEKRVSADVVTEEKLARLNKTMDQIVAKSVRPPLAGGAPNSVAGLQHKSAFETYMRKGEAGNLRALEKRPCPLDQIQMVATWCQARPKMP